MMRYFAIAGLILCALAQQAARADTLACAEHLHYLEWTQKYFDSAAAVFLGKVVFEEIRDLPVQPPPASHSPTPTTPNIASSMQELLDLIEAGHFQGPQPERVQTATFEVYKSWKGQIERTISVNANLYLDDTGYHGAVSKGDSYLVFAYKISDEDILRIPVGCEFRSSTRETESKIRVLDALTKKP